MIRLVRKVLTHSIHRHVLTDECLRTLFCEAESIVNSRPLTATSGDPGDRIPLTPNPILTSKGGEPQIILFNERDQFSTKHWKVVQLIAQDFWSRWKKEYLGELQKRQKWCLDQPSLVQGDIVLIDDPTTPRTHWPVATVTAVKHSADGRVRSVTVRNAYTTLDRPVNKIVKLFTPDNEQQ